MKSEKNMISRYILFSKDSPGFKVMVPSSGTSWWFRTSSITSCYIWNPTVDGNPANQLRLVVWFIPLFYRVLAPSQVVVWDFSHQPYEKMNKSMGYDSPSSYFAAGLWFEAGNDESCPTGGSIWSTKIPPRIVGFTKFTPARNLT